MDTPSEEKPRKRTFKGEGVSDYIPNHKMHSSPEEAGRDAARSAISAVVAEAKSMADLPAVSERVIAAMRAELARIDWELYESSFGDNPLFQPIKRNKPNPSSEYHNQYLTDFQQIVEGIRQSDEIILYEGLPAKADARYYDEWSTKKTLLIHGYRFYQELLPLGSEDAVKLTELCCDPQNFSLGPIEHLCMFHADDMLQWRKGEEITQTQFCFSCHDVAMFRGTNSLRVHIPNDVFESILGNYVKNYPK